MVTDNMANMSKPSKVVLPVYRKTEAVTDGEVGSDEYSHSEEVSPAKCDLESVLEHLPEHHRCFFPYLELGSKCLRDKSLSF